MRSTERQRLLQQAARSKLLWRGAGSAFHATTELFGLDIVDTTVAAASASLVDAAAMKHRLRVVFVNAHVVNEMASRPGYRSVVATADRIYADGSGLAVAARMTGQPLADNVNGTDLFPRLAADAAASGVGIFLLGGRPGIADAARERMTSFGLGDAIVGAHHGYFTAGSDEERAAIAAANSSGAAIVLVGMGVPLQDEWITRNASRLDARVLAGVGGLFDFFAGAVARSPHALRVVGCEWVWRLALEPRRMAHRYLVGNLRFLAAASVEAVKLRTAARATRKPISGTQLGSAT